MKRIYLIALFISISVYLGVSATSSTPLLIMDTYSAAGVGTANNCVARRGYVDFILQNPSLLASLENWHINFNYTSWILDTSVINANASYELPMATVGAGLAAFSMEEFDYYELDGALGQEKLSMNEIMFMLGAGRSLIDTGTLKLEAGVSAKFFNSKIQEYSGSTILFDIGASGIYKTDVIPGDFIYGLSLQNLGSGVTYDKESGSVPFKFRVGIGYRIFNFGPKGLFIPLVELISSDQFFSSLGAEYSYDDMVFVRLGYSFTSSETILSGFCLGLGVKYINIRFDYGLKASSYDNQSSLHSISLGYQF